MHLIGNIFLACQEPACMPQKNSVPPSRESEIWSQFSIENDHDGAIRCTSARNGLGGCRVSGPVSVAEDLFTNARRLWSRYNTPLREPLAAEDGRIQNDRAAIGHQPKRLLNRDQKALHVDGEDRVVVLLGYLAERSQLRSARVREYDVEPAFLALYLREQAIEIAEICDVSLHPR